MTSQYEEARRKNIEENSKRLKALNLPLLSESLRKSSSSTSKSSSFVKGQSRFVRPGDLEVANKKRLRSYASSRAPPLSTTPPTQLTTLPTPPPQLTTPPASPTQVTTPPTPPTRVTTPPATNQEIEDDVEDAEYIPEYDADDVEDAYEYDANDVENVSGYDANDVENVPLPPKKKARYWDVNVIDEAGHISRTRLMVTDVFQDSSNVRRVITSWNETHQPVGASAGLLAGFLGELARKFREFPIIFESWKDISYKKKTEFYDQKIKPKFVVDDGEHKKYILTSIARKWKDAKSRIFKKFYKWDLTLEENLRNYPRSIDPDNWACFVRYRRKKETMEKARKNAANRAKLRMNHSLGTKSIARTQDELQIRYGRKYSRAEMFGVSHKDSKGSFVNEEAKKKNDQLQAEIAKTRSETEAFVKVFGKEHGGSVRSMGLGVTPSQLTTSHPTTLTSSSEANEKIKKMQDQIDSLQEKASQVDILKEQVAFLMQKSRENRVIEESRYGRRSD
ncbi:Asparagine-rich protein (ARP protein) [Trifolium repens]|nr:Asparagine-rich protein (ARP protein) [Trifolium repens]